jgi:hypothetical protein
MDFLHALQESVGERKSFVDLNVRNYNYWAYKPGLEWLLVPTPGEIEASNPRLSSAINIG